MSAASSSWNLENKENVPIAKGKMQAITPPTRRDLELLDDNRVPADALGSVRAENERLKNRIKELESSISSMWHRAAATTIFDASHFLKGCDVSSVVVDGKDTLDATWLCRYLTIDIAGRLYLGDYNGDTIRRIDLDGTHTAIAGGTPGLKDGRGTEAQFQLPVGITSGPDDTLYVSDWGNHVLRRIDADGRVSTIAGYGGWGFKDGKGCDARFHAPYGCAVAHDGSVVVADYGNHCIRHVSVEGMVTTIGGNGTAGFTNGPRRESQFHYPTGVAVNVHGDVFVADQNNHMIRRIAARNGAVTTVAGSGNAGFDDGVGEKAQFHHPTDIAVGRDGALYVTDFHNHAVRCILPDGHVHAIAGTGHAGFRDGIGEQALFNWPQGITLASDGSIYVMDNENRRIRKITPRI
eukprot:GEMP01015157.1.p1 GENE.GEMP01015157.1~~GEMP01015157.1.p1  ORF type:complete len:408 (+),score=101.95 GEMP01015157.1:208-1431(+)